GTAVQIRSAPGDNPKTLADTGELSAPTPLQPGPNRVALSSADELSSVLVWITNLGNTDGINRAEISEITITAPALA
ncbi:hypothetical protein C6A85_000000107555, partial [Mycobacterium sp. ITM-2017-0098]